MDVWHPVLRFTGEDPYEDAEQYSNTDSEDTRIVGVEVEDGTRKEEVFVERRFTDGCGGGYREIACSSHPEEDLVEPMIEASTDLSGGTRMVYNYTEQKMALEEWVEPE